MVIPRGAHAATAPVVAPPGGVILGVGVAEVLVVAPAVEYLISRMAVDASWGTGALFQRNILR